VCATHVVRICDIKSEIDLRRLARSRIHHAALAEHVVCTAVADGIVLASGLVA